MRTIDKKTAKRLMQEIHNTLKLEGESYRWGSLQPNAVVLLTDKLEGEQFDKIKAIAHKNGFAFKVKPFSSADFEVWFY